MSAVPTKPKRIEESDILRNWVLLHKFSIPVLQYSSIAKNKLIRGSGNSILMSRNIAAIVADPGFYVGNGYFRCNALVFNDNFEGHGGGICDSIRGGGVGS